MVPPAESTVGVSPRVVRALALGASVLAHAALAVAVISVPTPVVQEPFPLVRLVFVEPPPPPPPAQVASAQPNARVVPRRKPKPVPKRPERPTSSFEKPAEVPVPLAPAQPEPEIASDATGVLGGIPGGVQGGTVGGILGGRGDAPVPTEGVARPPVVVEQVEPEYPTLARRRGIEGLVRLEAVLDRQGRIEEPIRVLESIAVLDEAAIEALRGWRFAPARDDAGDAVRVVLEVPMRFVLR